MMRAYIDRQYARVIFLGNKVYSIPLDQIHQHPELLNVPTFSDGAYSSLSQAIASPFSISINSAIPNQVVGSQPINSAKDFLVPVKDGCFIISKLQPELKFEGKHDAKSIDQIKKTYGEIPKQISHMIASGKLLEVDYTEVKRLKDAYMKMQQDKKSKEEARRKLGREIRRRGDDVSLDDSDDIGRNAVPIRL